MTGLGSSWSASYRADGLRASKTVSGTTTYYLYDGGEPVCEFNSSGTLIAYNVFAPDGLVARRKIASPTWTEYTFDQQGNVAQRLDASQNIITSSYYDAFGVENTTGTPTDQFGYNGRSGYFLDRETGLYLCQHRYFDPAGGRWITRDPIGYAGGINVYGYCGSGPVGGADSLGLQGLSPEFAGAMNSYMGTDTPAGVQSFWSEMDKKAQQAGGVAGNQYRFYRGVATGDTGDIVGGLVGLSTLVGLSAFGAEDFAANDIRPFLIPQEAGICEDTEVWRVWGGKSGEFGKSWTTQDPATMGDMRDELGLPNGNTWSGPRFWDTKQRPPGS